MVDFAKVLAQRKAINNAKMAEEMKNPTRIVPKFPEDIDKLRHLKDQHLGELNEWEANFVNDNFNFLKLNPAARLSDKVRGIMGKLEAEHCGSMCHALNRAGVPHA